MDNEKKETNVGDDHLNGDTAAEVSNDAPTVDITDDKTEQETKANEDVKANEKDAKANEEDAKANEEDAKANGEDTKEPSEDLLTKIKTQVEVYFVLHFHKNNCLLFTLLLNLNHISILNCNDIQKGNQHILFLLKTKGIAGGREARNLRFTGYYFQLFSHEIMFSARCFFYFLIFFLLYFSNVNI